MLPHKIRYESRHIRNKPGLIKQSKHPKRDFVSIAHFGFVNGHIAVGNVLDLVKAFLASAHFKQVLSIHKEISFWWMGHLMRLAQLVQEEQLPHCAYVGLHGESVHEVGVVEVDFLGSRQVGEFSWSVGE